ncbi:MAG: hypothetical protein HW400_585 [Candidatus Levybacteria bacterium]|nr:hypothetical protein [Candidatus Levybacteria bacterium]
MNFVKDFRLSFPLLLYIVSASVAIDKGNERLDIINTYVPEAGKTQLYSSEDLVNVNLALDFALTMGGAAIGWAVAVVIGRDSAEREKKSK